MNLDDLREPWQRRNREFTGATLKELAKAVATRAATFERDIRRRDWIETAAAVFVIGVFGSCVFQSTFPLIARLGMALIILGTLEIVIVLHWTRRRGGPPGADLPLADYFSGQLVRVERQIWLLRYVNWWYSSPPLIGACIFFFGGLFAEPLPWQISVPVFAALCGLVLLFGWKVYRINQRAVDKELLPLQRELAELCASLKDHDERMDE